MFRYREKPHPTSRAQEGSGGLATFGCDIGARGRYVEVGWREGVARRNLSGVRRVVAKCKWKEGSNMERRGGRERRGSHIETGSDP